MIFFVPNIAGSNHSGMLGKVIVMDSVNYNKWYENLVNSAPAVESPGLILLRNNNCLSCHSLDGSKNYWTYF